MCGLIGFSGADIVDEYKLKLIMLYNMSRGNHASGISINNRITKEAMAMDSFLAKWILKFSPTPTTTIIAHTRQASTGIDSKDPKNAHPFGIYEGGLDSSELDKET